MTNSGSITTEISEYCIDSTGNGTFAALAELGVMNELWIGSGNGTMQDFRNLWANDASIDQLVSFATQYNLSGVNIDLEPSGPTGTEYDAVLYSRWLAKARKALNAIDVRLTADVASWATIISNYTLLSGSVDRLFNMDTYGRHSSIDLQRV